MNELRHAFPGQDSKEPVFIFMRRYYIAFLPTVFFLLLMTVIYISLILIALTTLRDTPSLAATYNWMIALSGIFGLFIITFAAVAWLDFYFDIHIVTDRRVVDINQNRLFHREVHELNLEDVEDVSTEFKGIFSTLFNYGNIHIQTAGTKNNFLFPNMYDPRAVASVIVELAKQAKAGVKQVKRYPHTRIKGVINNHVATKRTDLVNQGAIKPHEKLPNNIK